MWLKLAPVEEVGCHVSSFVAEYSWQESTELNAQAVMEYDLSGVRATATECCPQSRTELNGQFAAETRKSPVTTPTGEQTSD